MRSEGETTLSNESASAPTVVGHPTASAIKMQETNGCMHSPPFGNGSDRRFRETCFAIFAKTFVISILYYSTGFADVHNTVVATAAR